MKTLLTIAGFDPSSGAGVTADLAVFAAHDFFGTACVTAYTIQSTRGVRGVHPLSAGSVLETLGCLQEDLPPAGIKIGILATLSNVSATAHFLRQLRDDEALVPVVLDPVMRSSSGRALLEPEGIKALREQLLPLVDWVTPNLRELAELSGRPVNDAGEMEQAAVLLGREFAALNVVATGGHLQDPDDLLVAAQTREPQWLRGEKVLSRATHGTGCAFSSALLCELVRGAGPVEAAREAKTYVAEAIRRASVIGHGSGPMNLLWRLCADLE